MAALFGYLGTALTPLVHSYTYLLCSMHGVFISTSSGPPNWEADVAKEGLGTVANNTYFAGVKQQCFQKWFEEGGVGRWDK